MQSGGNFKLDILSFDDGGGKAFLQSFVAYALQSLKYIVLLICYLLTQTFSEIFKDLRSFKFLYLFKERVTIPKRNTIKKQML